MLVVWKRGNAPYVMKESQIFQAENLPCFFHT
jgi:hypothetical protein